MRRTRLVFADQYFAFSGMIGGADQALLLHALDQSGGTIIADAEPALQITRGDLAILEHAGNRRIVELVAGLAIGFALAVVLVALRFLFRHRFEIVGHAL